MGTPEVGIPIGTAGDGCWLDSSQSGDTWMKRGATHKKKKKILTPFIFPNQILLRNNNKADKVHHDSL